ncbi:MAG: thioredoxin domain-containing protein [Anaerolineae bacterium]|nr:thioredoxin domain-containing protein [Anaerolineae bacterium]
MVRKTGALVVLLMVVVLVLSACSSTATSEPTATVEPTEVATQEPTAIPEPAQEEPTGPLAIATPEQPGICEAQAVPELPARPVDEMDWIKGASEADADVTILEYAEFQCPGCSGIAPVLDQFLKDHPHVRLVYRHFPLSFHDKALLTAQAAEAAGAQGKFWEMYDLLFGRVSEWNSLSPEEARVKMSEFAADLGLDVEQFDREVDDETYLPKINAQLEESQNLQLPGTPTFIFNGLMFPGQQLGLSYQGLESFLSIMELTENQYDEAPATTLDTEKSYQATLSTSKGDIVVNLLPESAPVNVNSFIFLAQEGWYEGTEFFFVEDNFVALAGDPSNTGLGYPGYYCTGETQGTFDRTGLIGMLPNGQIFITLGMDASELSGKFALIGQVVEGDDVLAALTRRSPADPAVTDPDLLESVTVVEK